MFDWDTRGFLTCIEKTQHNHTPTRYDMHVNALGVLTRVNNTRVQWDINTSIPLVTSVDDHPVESLGGASYLGTGMSSSWRRTRQQSLLNPYESDTRGVPAYSHDVMLAEAGLVSVDGFTIMGARVYDCSTLGFLSPDPYPYLVPGAVWQSYAYNYAANNPLSLTDPTGFKPVTDISVINAYNTSRSLNIWDNTKKFAKNSLSWQTVAGLVITGVGAGLMFTGIGGPVGGALIGAGLDVLIQQGTTRNVDWTEVAVGTVAGLAGGSIIGKTGGILAKSTLGIRVAQKVGSVDSKFVRWGIGKLGEFAQDKLSEVTGNLIESGTNTLLHRPTNWSESIANPFTAEGLAKSAVSTGIGNGSIHAAESYYGKELA
ncbi:MAG: hypothetical protein HUJ62_06780, partial [Streptococcus gallolyticus]|nr:hypothetical protein [Streptococcus gallolyticus]